MSVGPRPPAPRVLPRSRPRLGRARRVWLALALAAVYAPGAAAVPPHPSIAVGGFPTGITLDGRTGTLYVDDGTTGTLSLIDGRTCNARVRRGCSQRVTTVSDGVDPVGGAVSESTDTLYVANALAGTVAIFDAATCRATDPSGCRRAAVTVPVGVEPQFLSLDERSGTLYVANSGSNTVSVIDARTCNARVRRGCRAARATIPVGPGPFTLAVDDATGSIYVADLLADTVSVLDARTCNAEDVHGCSRRPVTVDVGETPGGIALDTATDTIYVTGQSSDDVAVIDGRTCNATVTSGCRRRPLLVAAGAGARGIAVDEATDTVYVADTAANAVSVIDGSSCNATVTSGCRQRAALAPVGLSPRRIAVDEATNTIYVTNAGSDTVTMLDGATCDGRSHGGCGAGASPAGTTSAPIYRASTRSLPASGPARLS